MSRLVCQILLSILLLPIASGVYMAVFSLCEAPMRRSADDSPFLAAGMTTLLFVIVYWPAVWRRTVRWTRRRVIWTILLIPASVGVAGTLSVGIDSTLGYRPGGPLFWFLAGLLIPTFWLFGTTLLWRDTREEQALRGQGISGVDVACPKCGYSMKGLYESRCPECGARFTLDQLVAGQGEGRIR